MSGQAGPEISIRTIGFPPYGIHIDQTFSGIYFDLANALATEAGFLANNSVSPYARIISELKSGHTDMTIMFRYPELEEHVVYVVPLPPLKTVVIGRSGTVFDSLDSLKNKKIAYLRGASFSDAIDEDSSIIKQRTADFLQGVRMMMAGRVDAIIGPMDPILSAAAKINRGAESFGEPFVVSERTPWIQVSKRGKHLQSVETLETAFNALQSRGVLTQLHEKYLAPNRTVGQ